MKTKEYLDWLEEGMEVHVIPSSYTDAEFIYSFTDPSDSCVNVICSYKSYDIVRDEVEEAKKIYNSKLAKALR